MKPVVAGAARVLGVLSLGVVSLACGSGGPAPRPEPDEVLLGTVTERELRPTIDGRDLSAVVEAEKRLAVALLRRAREEAPGANAAVGAYSLYQVLGMLYAGARGETARQMETALGWTLPPERLHPAMNALDLELEKRREDVELDLANRVWAQRGLPVRAEFLDVLTRDHGAPLAITDFASDPEAARGEINDWVRRVTADRIPSLMPQGSIDGQTVLVLVNAMFVDAPWKYKLDPAATHDQPFHLADGTTVSVPTMQYDQYLPAARGQGWNAVELPFRGDELSMIFVVPEALEPFEDAFTVSTLNQIVEAIHDGGIHLSLPKLRFSSHRSLVEAMRSMGMTSLFESPDLSGISEAGLGGVQALEHEVFIEVDEEGVKAAAATGASIPGSHGPTVSLDRPFLFFLIDRPTGAILFIGRVLDPRAS